MPSRSTALLLLRLASLVALVFLGLTTPVLVKWISVLGCIGLLAAVLIPTLRQPRVILALWAALAVAVLVPVDISFRVTPGPPHWARQLGGTPDREGILAIKRGEAIPGSCCVTGWEPKWVWVW